MSLAVANRYARAFVDVAVAARLNPAEVQEQLLSFGALWQESPELRGILLSPAVSVARKRAVIERLCARLGVGEKVRNFILVIGGHRRLALYTVICQAVEARMDERMGLLRARITSAREITASQQSSLEAALASRTGLPVRCDFAVDGALLGGAVARIGSTIYDGSVRGRLEELRHKLAEERR